MNEKQIALINLSKAKVLCEEAERNLSDAVLMLSKSKALEDAAKEIKIIVGEISVAARAFEIAGKI